MLRNMLFIYLFTIEYLNGALNMLIIKILINLQLCNRHVIIERWTVSHISSFFYILTAWRYDIRLVEAELASLTPSLNLKLCCLQSVFVIDYWKYTFRNKHRWDERVRPSNAYMLLFKFFYLSGIVGFFVFFRLLWSISIEIQKIIVATSSL